MKFSEGSDEAAHYSVFSFLFSTNLVCLVPGNIATHTQFDHLKFVRLMTQADLGYVYETECLNVTPNTSSNDSETDISL